RISGNHFEGSIPPCVSRLKLLYYMYVDTNRFTGRLPNSIGTMTNLQNLFINQNSIAGPLPATITRLRKLRILFMSSNPKLTGRLPRNLGNMVGLTDLVMEFCNFSGPIPPSITRLTRLQRLLLDNNYFRGIVPENLSRLTDITILYLERNFLYGTFPKGISQLPKLAYLNLHSNLLTGPLPTNFPSTRFIDYGQYNLRNNFFNGPAVVTAGGRSFCPVNHTYTGVFFESSLAKNCLTYPVGSPCEKAGLVQPSPSIHHLIYHRYNATNFPPPYQTFSFPSPSASHHLIYHCIQINRLASLHKPLHHHDPPLRLFLLSPPIPPPSSSPSSPAPAPAIHHLIDHSIQINRFASLHKPLCTTMSHHRLSSLSHRPYHPPPPPPPPPPPFITSSITAFRSTDLPLSISLCTTMRTLSLGNPIAATSSTTFSKGTLAVVPWGEGGDGGKALAPECTAGGVVALAVPAWEHLVEVASESASGEAPEGHLRRGHLLGHL
ncbi:unnamed protein product, partial [Closterium sp. NIES-64]